MSITKTKTAEKGIVLIVEDDLKLAALNRKILEEEGCVTLIANTLAEARKCLTVSAPDLVLLDIMLPDGSGLDFMPEIKCRENCPHVIFLTARSEKDYIIAGLESGGIDYIRKPYDLPEFRHRVMNLLKLVCESRKRKTLSAETSALTKRELTVAVHAADGMSNKEIAYAVYLSESHVKNCLGEVYRKLGIADDTDKRTKLAGFFYGAG